MSESNDLKPTVPAGTPVPDLIEQYRIRRDAWIAQADELARLRDEVRGSAEREAMEIVTAARRDVRHIVMEARRELLVLSAQVQAALGEAGGRSDPAALLNRARSTGSESAGEDSQFSESVFASEDAVKDMLDEAGADMDALAEDARAVPLKALAEPAVPLASQPKAASPFIVERIPVPQPPPSPVGPAASRVLLSSPFPSDAVPVPHGRRVRTFVTLFGLAGVGILAGTIWWLGASDGAAAPDTVARSTAPDTTPIPSPTLTPAVSSVPEAPSAVPATGSEPAPGLSLLVEARRSSWLRTTVDGRSDVGRLLAEGATVRITAQRSVALRVGDAGAVFVSVNGGEASALGRDGQVVTRQFDVENGERRAETAQALPAAPTTRPPLAPPVASGRSVPAAGPGPVPLLQPVAAAPPTSAVDLAPPPASRVETLPPPIAPRAETPTLAPTSPASAVIAASRQWLDAYHRQDRATIASLSTEGLTLADERRTEERFPANVEVNRTLDRVSVQIAADTAVLTAVMTERSPDNTVPPRVSPISQVWELRGNQWRVRQVRLVSEARLNQIFR
jgi:hypothetical protein